MSFWLRNLVLGVVLIGLAYLFLANQDLLLSLDKEWVSEEQAPPSEQEEEDEATTEIAKPVENKKLKNAAAEGLSNFYASLHEDMGGSGPKIRNNVVYLPDPKGDLVQILEARRIVNRPLRKNWKGTTASRPFRTGETLFQKLSEYAGEDGLDVLWRLNLDFVVKDPFRIEKNILATAYSVGKAVEGHFDSGITIFFCYQHRALVLVKESIPYLEQECSLLSTN